MMKPMTRIIVGLALLYGAWCSYQQMVSLIREATNFRKDLSPGNLDFFDEDLNPLKEPPSPARLQKTRDAEWFRQLTLLIGCPGIFLILLGVAPTCFRVLVWLFIPDFMRRSHADPDRSGLPGDRPAGDEAGGEPEASAPDAA